MIARAHMDVELGQCVLRFDHQAAPALEIEPEGHIVGDRVPAADVDVGSRRLAGKDEIEVVVLEVLRIGELHHFARCAGRRSGYEWRRYERIISEGRRLANAMTPPIITTAGPLLACYDVVFCDVWGVLHNGRRAF